MIKRASSAVIFLFVLTLFPVNASAGVPDWLRNAAQQPVKKYADDVDAVVLLQETETTVKDNGETITHERRVIKVLRPAGREAAVQAVAFDEETRLGYFKGWSISTSGQEYEAKKDDIFEVSGGEGYEIYSDSKVKAMRIPGVDVGTVVGVEWEQKRHPYTFEDQWYFQSSRPVERARFVLHIPSGWDYHAAWLHYAEQSPAVQGGTSVWELADVPRIESEAEMPHARALEGQLVVTYFSEKTKGRTYSSWADFGAWYSQLTINSRDPSPSLQQKVQELAPASMPVLERVKALTRFAQQDIRYAAIEIGIGGYQPHPASQILSSRYGDCKDKATILSAMLAQIGVKSYYILIHTDRGIYTEKTPPMNGFNHAILAIQLPSASFSEAMPALYQHKQLGNLLIFDPTSTVVPFGQIPYYEQDNYGLLVHEQEGELIHLPLSKAELNRITRTGKLALLPDGSMKGEIMEVRTGSQAAESRATFGRQTIADRRKSLEQYLGHMIGSFQLDSVEADNLENIDKELVIRYKFSAQHYAKSAGPLLLVRPRVLGEKLGALDSTKPRHYAYSFDAPTLQTDTFEFSLPDGYKIDELPDAAKASFAFGEYSSKIEGEGNSLKYSREYRINATSIPADRIGDLSKFFHQINADEKNMAVLKKAN
jgi:transglutaminase-like putative cysteine protease